MAEESKEDANKGGLIGLLIVLVVVYLLLKSCSFGGASCEDTFKDQAVHDGDYTHSFDPAVLDRAAKAYCR